MQSGTRRGVHAERRHQSEHTDNPTTLRCPSCGDELPIGPDLPERKLMCMKCGELIDAPVRKELSLAEPAPPAKGSEATPAPAETAMSWRSVLSQPRALGLASLVLALLGVEVLCLPFADYAGIILPGLGLLLGARGLFLSGRKISTDFVYSLAGVLACALALAFVIGTLTRKWD
jgi:hypothetical protein